MPFCDDVRDRGPAVPAPVADGSNGPCLPRRLAEVAAELDGDELRVLIVVAERLVKGRRHYGVLRLDADLRRFAVEALEEAADGLAYAAMGLLRDGGAA